MSRLGADPLALRQLGAAFNRLSVQAELTAATLGRRVRHSSWQGADAQAFSADWQRRQQPYLRSVAVTCARCSVELKQQAQQQEQASAAESGRTATEQPQAPHTPAAFPSSELRVLSGTQITAGGLYVGVTNNLSIQQLPMGRVRIVSTERNQAGLAATAGASVSAGTQTASLGANLRAQVGVAQLTRREYFSSQSKLVPMLALIEAEAAVRRVASSGSVFPGVGVAALMLSEGARASSTQEQLTELNISALSSASIASSLGVHGAVRGTGSFRFGRGENSQILELEGTAASLLSGQLLQRVKIASSGEAGSTLHLARLRIEVPDQARDGADLVLSTTTTDGRREFRTVSNLDVSEASTWQSTALLTQSIEHLQHGQLDQAVRSLSRLELPTAEASTRSGEFILRHHTGILEANIGAGVGLGISGEGGYQQLRLVS
ncbi:MAG: hypothetical protein WD029_09660 [Microthrixaceae bacterium]